MWKTCHEGGAGRSPSEQNQEPTMLHIDHPGLYTRLQDLGRFGYQAYGVPVGGALDRASAALANQLVGNAADEPVLEITIQGPSLTIEEELQIALTGADLSPTLNGAPMPMYESVRASGGSQLRFGRPVSGCRAYLAVRGRWQVQRWLGSVSPPPHQAERLTADSVLKKGSRVEIEHQGFLPKRIYPEYARPGYRPPHRVQLLPGPEFEQFEQGFIAWFVSQGHRVSADSNRMGCRLDTKPEAFAWEEELISSAVLPGTVQIAHSGQAIVLLADAQTTGGYPRLGVAPAQELGRLAQVRPGEVVWFGF